MPCARGNWVERGTCVMSDLKVRLVLMSLLAKCSRDTRLTHRLYFWSTWYEPEIITVMLLKWSSIRLCPLSNFTLVVGFWSQLCFCRPLKASSYSGGPLKKRYSQSPLSSWDKIMSVGSSVKMPLNTWKLTWRLRHETWTNNKFKPIKRAMNSDWADHRHDTKLFMSVSVIGVVWICYSMSPEYSILCDMWF